MKLINDNRANFGLRKCKKCGEEKPFASFKKSKKCIGGRGHVCGICVYKRKISLLDKEGLKRLRKYDLVYKHRRYYTDDNFRKRALERGKRNRDGRPIPINFNRYKHAAKKKGRVFELSFERFKELVEAKCYYCNELGDRPIRGIDRLDSAIGYIEGNVVSCCIVCNLMKRDVHVDIFIKRCESITNNLKNNT